MCSVFEGPNFAVRVVGRLGNMRRVEGVRLCLDTRLCLNRQLLGQSAHQKLRNTKPGKIENHVPRLPVLRPVYGCILKWNPGRQKALPDHVFFTTPVIEAVIKSKATVDWPAALEHSQRPRMSR